MLKLSSTDWVLQDVTSDFPIVVTKILQQDRSPVFRITQKGFNLNDKGEWVLCPDDIEFLDSSNDLFKSVRFNSLHKVCDVLSKKFETMVTVDHDAALCQSQSESVEKRIHNLEFLFHLIYAAIHEDLPSKIKSRVEIILGKHHSILRSRNQDTSNDFK